MREDWRSLSLSGCIKIRKHELLCKRDDLAPLLPHAWFWAPQGKQPLGIGKLPEIELRAAKMGFDAAGGFQLCDPPSVLLKGQGAQSDHGILNFYFSRVLFDTTGHTFSVHHSHTHTPP